MPVTEGILLLVTNEGGSPRVSTIRLFPPLPRLTRSARGMMERYLTNTLH